MLDVENLSAGYGGENVVGGISFSVADGERLAVVGPNGCGKSTLLRAVCGIVSYSGAVSVGGENLRGIKKRADVAKKIALLPQFSAPYFDYSVRETVDMGGYAFSGERRDVFAEKWLDRMGLSDIADRPITTLSGGQLQRVFIARIFTQNPDVILLDEPTNHLDLSYRAELSDILSEWVKQGGKSVVAVLHDLSAAASVSDRTLLMGNGKSVLVGDTCDVLKSDEISEVYGFDVVEYMRKALVVWS